MQFNTSQTRQSGKNGLHIADFQETHNVQISYTEFSQTCTIRESGKYE